MRAVNAHGFVAVTLTATHLTCANSCVAPGASSSSVAVVVAVSVWPLRAGHGGAIKASRITTGGAGGSVGSAENSVSWPALLAVDVSVDQPLCAALTTSARRTRG